VTCQQLLIYAEKVDNDNCNLFPIILLTQKQTMKQTQQKQNRHSHRPSEGKVTENTVLNEFISITRLDAVSLVNIKAGFHVVTIQETF